jgi:hypothetical protein
MPRAGGAIEHVALGNVPVAARGDHRLHDVLQLLHRGGRASCLARDGVHHELRDGQHVGEVAHAEAVARAASSACGLGASWCRSAKKARAIARVMRSGSQGARRPSRLITSVTGVAMPAGVAGGGRTGGVGRAWPCGEAPGGGTIQKRTPPRHEPTAGPATPTPHQTTKAPCIVRKEPRNGAARATGAHDSPRRTPPSRVRTDSVALAGLLARDSSREPPSHAVMAQWPDAPLSSLTAAGPPRNHTGFPLRARPMAERPAPMSCLLSRTDEATSGPRPLLSSARCARRWLAADDGLAVGSRHRRHSRRAPS